MGRGGIYARTAGRLFDAQRSGHRSCVARRQPDPARGRQARRYRRIQDGQPATRLGDRVGHLFGSLQSRHLLCGSASQLRARWPEDPIAGPSPGKSSRDLPRHHDAVRVGARTSWPKPRRRPASRTCGGGSVAAARRIDVDHHRRGGDAEKANPAPGAGGFRDHAGDIPSGAAFFQGGRGGGRRHRAGQGRQLRGSHRDPACPGAQDHALGAQVRAHRTVFPGRSDPRRAGIGGSAAAAGFRQGPRQGPRPREARTPPRDERAGTGTG